MIFSVFCFSLVAFSQARILEWDPLAPRIINGEDAKPGELPYQVSIQSKHSFHFCGGAVLNENYVITAAHCVVSKKPYDIKVIAGTLKLSAPKSTRLVKKIIVHKNYNVKDSWKNDIALLKVRTPFKFSDRISMVPLPNWNKINAYDNAVVSGWGSRRYGGSSPDHLQRVDLIIAEQKFCKKVYEKRGFIIHHSQICAYDPDVVKGTCHGDSGGPLTVDGVLAGLVSWANGCANTKYPTVYTRVSEFLDWIERNAV